MGRLSGPDIALGFAVTALWLILFSMVYRILWRLGVKRYEAVGA
jgi:ABC-2 type transport system permease protein